MGYWNVCIAAGAVPRVRSLQYCNLCVTGVPLLRAAASCSALAGPDRRRGPSSASAVPESAIYFNFKLHANSINLQYANLPGLAHEWLEAVAPYQKQKTEFRARQVWGRQVG